MHFFAHNMTLHIRKCSKVTFANICKFLKLWAFMCGKKVCMCANEAFAIGLPSFHLSVWRGIA